MIVPIPPPRADGRQALRAGGQEPRHAPEDDSALLRRLDANELYDIHQGLDWCEREMRAIGLLRPGRRIQLAALRRRWAHRWRAATGRPAVSLQAHRAWQLAAIGGLCATFLALVSGPDQPDPPAPGPMLVMPAPQVAAAPVPTPIPTPQATANATDRMAKSQARHLARGLLHCRRVSGTFLGCADIAASQVTPNITIAELTPDRFMITATAGSGNVFSIVRGPDGVTLRRCTTQDVGGCPRTGHW
jgi:hypothetical protein